MIKIINQIQQHSVVHLDIKPGNIIFNARGQMYLCDFGSSLIAVLDDNGKFVYSPQVVQTDSRFRPKDNMRDVQPEEMFENLSRIDNYQAGLTIALICLGMENYLNDLPLYKSYPHELLRKLKDANVPRDMLVVLEGLLQSDSNRRMTIEEAWEKAQQLNPVDEEDIQAIFSKLMELKNAAEEEKLKTITPECMDTENSNEKEALEETATHHAEGKEKQIIHPQVKVGSAMPVKPGLFNGCSKKMDAENTREKEPLDEETNIEDEEKEKEVIHPKANLGSGSLAHGGFFVGEGKQKNQTPLAHTQGQIIALPK